MKKNLSLLATLALAATLSPAGFAQQSQSQQPDTDRTRTEPNPNQTQAQPGSDQPQTQTKPSTGSMADTQNQNSFSGTVIKVGKHYVLKTDTMTYELDDQTKARQFEGKQVTVNGTLDKSTSMIRVTDIQPAS